MQRTNQQLAVGREKGGGATEGQEIKRYKLSCIKQTTWIYCTTQGIQPIFYNNYKWAVIFKNIVNHCVVHLYGEGDGTPLQYSCLENPMGRRSPLGCSPWGRKESDMTERLHFHFSLSCIGQGNGNPLQCSCLENPRDGGAWWAAVYGVAQSQTGLT